MYKIELRNKALILPILFFLALTIHLIGLNKIGRTWDEQFKVDMGYIAWSSLAAKDFSVDSWNFVSEHPMVAKYIYSLFMGPQMIRLDDGAGHYVNFTPNDINALETGNYIKTQLGNKLYMISYDLTTPRFISAIFNSLAVALTVFIALYFLKEIWAIVAGVFLLFTPRFVVMGQLITFESLSVSLFCLTALLFYKLLNNPKSTRLYLLLGVLCGLLFWTRYDNIFIFVFLAGWFVIDYIYKKNKDILNIRLLLIPPISFLLGIIIWPLVWHNFPKYLVDSFVFHQSRNIGPSLYFIERLIVTTPMPILFGLAIGLIWSLKERKYWNAVFVWWFFSTIIFYSILALEGGGTRYIFVIYPAIAILCSYGYFVLLRKRWIYALIPIFIFLAVEMIGVYPYYLDYYNQLVGGVNGAVKRGYEFSWWGEGQREVGFYINNNIPSGSSIGLIVTPKYVFPALRTDLKNKGYVDAKTDADYIVVSGGDIPNKKKISSKSQLIYAAEVDGEPLVLLFKKKN